MGRVDYQLAHLIHINPEDAKKQILEALRAEKMHMTNTAALIGCTHGTLLGWIAKLDGLGVKMTDGIAKLKAIAQKEGWHWVNVGNPNSKGRPLLSKAEKKRRAAERAARSPAQKKAAAKARANNPRNAKAA